jgi:hypothetical protein
MAHSLDTILKPLAITVIIDHEVKDVERTTFIELARGLLDFFGHPPVSNEKLLEWFMAQRATLEDQLWDKGGNTLVLRALTAFKDDAECEAVYDAMVTLSLCDDKFVTEESRLIKSAASIYGYPLPPRKIDR